MLWTLRGLLALGLLSFALPLMAAEGDKDEMVANPKYKFWAGFKAGATAVHVEKTKHSGEDKAAFPDGVEEKVISYTLLSVNDKQAVVRVVVVEREHFGSVESAPTKITYPARIKKSHLEAVFAEFGAKIKDEEAVVKVGGKDINCKIVIGSTKKGDDTVEFRLMFSETVPGGIVSRMRTAKQGDKTIAETTITLRSFGEGAPKKDKPKEKAKE